MRDIFVGPYNHTITGGCNFINSNGPYAYVTGDKMREKSLDQVLAADEMGAALAAILPLRRYIEDKQPRYVYHGHVHAEIGAMVGESAVISVFGAKVVTLR